MSIKTLLKSKKWIDPNTTGFIYTKVESDDGYKQAELKIADCSRIVSLDVYIDSAKARDKTLRKVRLIVEELTKFKDTLETLTYEV